MGSWKLLTGLMFMVATNALAQDYEYRLLATLRITTMQEELNEAAAEGFRFQTAMGGESAFGGKEVIAVMSRTQGETAGRFRYKLLATKRTSTMERELEDAARGGYVYRAQTVFDTAEDGHQVVVILERDNDAPSPDLEYLLLATVRTSTMQKELSEAGSMGYLLMGMTIGKTAFGGEEVVAILSRRRGAR